MIQVVQAGNRGEYRAGGLVESHMVKGFRPVRGKGTVIAAGRIVPGRPRVRRIAKADIRGADVVVIGCVRVEGVLEDAGDFQPPRGPGLALGGGRGSGKIGIGLRPAYPGRVALKSFPQVAEHHLAGISRIHPQPVHRRTPAREAQVEINPAVEEIGHGRNIDENL